jgi:RIO-like serine/threonine protein kinase
MWYLLYNITRAGSKFEKIGKKVGDISPHNVLINDNGLIKVISTCSIPNELNNFQKVVEDIHTPVYLGTSI